MGLDCSHDAFSGAYSAFSRLRQVVCYAAGGTYPPHWTCTPDGMPRKRLDGSTDTDYRRPGMESVGDEECAAGDGFSRATHPGLYEFIAHSDCDGEIAPEMCAKVADDLEALLPAIEEVEWLAVGHLARLGHAGTVRRFIAGCRAAAAAGEPLRFR